MHSWVLRQSTFDIILDFTAPERLYHWMFSIPELRAVHIHTMTRFCIGLKYHIDIIQFKLQHVCMCRGGHDYLMASCLLSSTYLLFDVSCVVLCCVAWFVRSFQSFAWKTKPRIQKDLPLVATIRLNLRVKGQNWKKGDICVCLSTRRCTYT